MSRSPSAARRNASRGACASCRTPATTSASAWCTTAPNGLEKINPKTREQDPKHWAACVKVIKDILEQHQPKVVIFPHDRDWNSTHIGTHYLVMDALKQMPASFTCYLVETEFWGAMTDPNLMVEISAEDLADMMAATTFHVGGGEAQSLPPAAAPPG